MIRITLLCLIILIITACNTSAGILHIGHGQKYPDITTAAKLARPGDTLLLHNGTYTGHQSIQHLHGHPDKWIYIIAENKGTVEFKGGTTAWNCTSVAYLHMEGITFTGQSGNGVNIDDGGNYANRSHHIRIVDCTFRDMAATGNNDLLKLSCVDDVVIKHCNFLNGSKGGSGIDMVGCHAGSISDCRFENMGANALQMKGGSSDMVISACRFKDCGSRAINLGGSTGTAFFRPANASFEASRLRVYSCVFIGSEVPVAFVGCTKCEVINNTIYKPGKWVIRILQENRDTSRVAPCGDNIFRNNIVYVDERVQTTCNVGPGTAPESFTFSNNLWFRAGDPRYDPQLPVVEKGGVIGKDPLLGGDFRIRAGSPAAGAGFPVDMPFTDYAGRVYGRARGLGAFEIE